MRARLPSSPGNLAAICSLKVEYSLSRSSTSTKRVLPLFVLNAFTSRTRTSASGTRGSFPFRRLPLPLERSAEPVAHAADREPLLRERGAVDAAGRFDHMRNVALAGDAVDVLELRPRKLRVLRQIEVAAVRDSLEL